MRSLLVWVAVVAGVAACGGSRAASPDPASSEKLAALDKRVTDIDTRLQRIEELLAAAMGGGTKEPDPNTVYAVPVDGDPMEGPANAKVTVIKAFEFACGFCYSSRPTVDKIREVYGDNVRVVYKYFIVHDQAVAPGLAACAAHRQGKFTEMKNLIWDEGFAKEDISPEHMSELASQAGLDRATFEADVAHDGPCMEWLKNSYGSLTELGVRGTPAWYVNGRYLAGAQPFESFKALIDEELAKANKAIAKGVPQSDYYLREILAKGATEL